MKDTDTNRPGNKLVVDTGYEQGDLLALMCSFDRSWMLFCQITCFLRFGSLGRKSRIFIILKAHPVTIQYNSVSRVSVRPSLIAKTANTSCPIGLDS